MDRQLIRQALMEQVGSGLAIEDSEPVHPQDVEPTTPDSTMHSMSLTSYLAYALGAYAGGVVLAQLAGLPLGQCLGLSAIVVAGATRVRQRGRRRSAGPIFQTISVGAVLAAVALVVTSTVPFRTDLRAAGLVRSANADIARDDLKAAFPKLGRADLLAKGSVRTLITSACVDWDLGFRDDAVLEVEGATLFGWRIHEPSGYRDNGCFLDAVQAQGLAFLTLPEHGLTPRSRR